MTRQATVMSERPPAMLPGCWLALPPYPRPPALYSRCPAPGTAATPPRHSCYTGGCNR